jgi:hypothetical protein
LALLLCSGGLSAAPCNTQTTPVVVLSITAAEVKLEDRTLRIQVGPEGCVLIHRPAYYKSAGTYRVQLSATEFQQLTQHLSPALRSIDASALHARIASAERNRTIAPEQHLSLSPGPGRSPTDAAHARSFDQQRFQVMDADRYVLETRLEGAAASRLTFDGLLAYAEHYPEVPELQELGSLIGALQQLAMRNDAETAATVSP